MCAAEPGSMVGGPGTMSARLRSGWSLAPTVTQRMPPSPSVMSSRTSRPSFPVKNSLAESWSRTQTVASPSFVIMPFLLREQR